MNHESKSFSWPGFILFAITVTSLFVLGRNVYIGGPHALVGALIASFIVIGMAMGGGARSERVSNIGIGLALAGTLLVFFLGLFIYH